MKNNYTIIVGCGDLGINLATNLYLNDNDVLVIDNNEKSIKNLPSNFGGLTISRVHIGNVTATLPCSFYLNPPA